MHLYCILFVNNIARFMAISKTEREWRPSHRIELQQISVQRYKPAAATQTHEKSEKGI